MNAPIHNTFFPLEGLLFCRMCRKVMTGRMQDGIRVYRCPDTCRHPVAADWVEAVIRRELAGRVATPLGRMPPDPLTYANRTLARVGIGAPTRRDITMSWRPVRR